jgi:hypothetical protein
MALMVTCTTMVLCGADEPNVPKGKQPNLLVDVSAGLVNAVVQRPVDRTEPIEDVILDTPIRGEGRTQGMVWAELCPDTCHISLDVIFRGKVCGQSVAIRPHVLIYGSSTTSVEVRRRVAIDAERIRVMAGPSDARTFARVHEITNRNGDTYTAATQFAWLDAAGRKDEAQDEAAGKTARRVSNRIADDLTPVLTSVSENVARGMSEMKKAKLTLDFLDFHTTAGFLHVRGRLATPGRVQAGPPLPLPADTDLGLRVHQSLINETAQALMGGKSFNLLDLKKLTNRATSWLLRENGKSIDPNDSQKSLEKMLTDLAIKTTSITFARQDPLVVTFAGQEIKVEIQVASFHSDGKESPGLRLHAAYRLEVSSAGVHAVRKGPLLFEENMLKNTEKRPNSFRQLQELAFADVLRDRFVLGPFPIPESTGARQLRPSRADAVNGWMALSWTVEP